MLFRDYSGAQRDIQVVGPPERVERNMEETPEGFLLCRNVALARTGDQVYMSWEVPVQAARDVRVVVERPEAEVFRPETVESFRGKPLTNNHPAEDVSPENYRTHMIGVVQNPRRGTGDRAHCLVGDILVYDAKAIRDIRSGKREVSCGYNANYERIAPGRGRQVNIVGNHVALVHEGRCGPECAINDSKPSERKSIMPKIVKTKGFMDAMRSAFASFQDSDEENLNKSLQAAAKSLAETPEDSTTDTPEPPDVVDGEGNHHHVTVNIGGMEAGRRPAASTGDEEPMDETVNSPSEDGSITKYDVVAAIAAAIKPLIDRLDSLEDSVGGARDPDDVETQDSVARAEILRPGIQLPTFDAAPGSRAQREALTGLQRRALKEAFATQDGRPHIAPLVSSARPNFDAMTPSEIGVLFRAASERARDANNRRVQDSGSAAYIVQDGKKRVLDNRTWNEINREYHKKQKTA